MPENEQVYTPEQLEQEKTRTISDAELLKGGAEYREVDGQKILNLTAEQIEQIYKEFNSEEFNTAMGRLSQEWIWLEGLDEEWIKSWLASLDRIDWDNLMAQSRELGIPAMKGWRDHATPLFHEVKVDRTFGLHKSKDFSYCPGKVAIFSQSLLSEYAGDRSEYRQQHPLRYLKYRTTVWRKDEEGKWAESKSELTHIDADFLNEILPQIGWHFEPGKGK
jgi:hypothetical protein